MTEPIVTLTDYALAIEAACFAILLSLRNSRCRQLRTWLVLLFVSVSSASFFGGTVHGFLLGGRTPQYPLLWSATLVAMGVTALSMYAIGAALLLSRAAARWLICGATLQFALYCMVVLLGHTAFWIALADNLPAIVFLSVALGLRSRFDNQPRILLAAAGPALVLVAAGLQQLGVGFHPKYFNHNALYHVLQAVALLLLFIGIRPLPCVGR